jgi:hypothetical protein
MQAASTVTGYRITVRHLVELIGNLKLADLKLRDVDFALGKLAKRFSTRSVRLARMILIQAIRNAMVNDRVVRNVADLANVPTGKPGRPSRSLNLEQALAALDAAKGERLWPYVAMSMLGASAPRKPAPCAGPRWNWRPAPWPSTDRYGASERPRPEKSRRVFQIPEVAVGALRDLVLQQAAAYLCHRAGLAIREQRKDEWEPKMAVRLPVRPPSSSLFFYAYEQREW